MVFAPRRTETFLIWKQPAGEQAEADLPFLCAGGGEAIASAPSDNRFFNNGNIQEVR